MSALHLGICAVCGRMRERPYARHQACSLRCCELFTAVVLEEASRENREWSLGQRTREEAIFAARIGDLGQVAALERRRDWKATK